MTSVQDFEAAVARVNGLPKAPGNDVLLQLYAFYKQATAGDATGKRPGMFDMRGRAKFDAWSKHSGMTQEAAREGYAKLASSLK